MKVIKKLLLILLGAQFSLPAIAFNYTNEGVTLTYTVLDEEAKTVSVQYSSNTITSAPIPAVAIDGETEYTVVKIADSGFSRCTKITTVTIPETVTSIGNSAFSGCTRLANITIPESVTSIGNSAFSSCSYLRSCRIPDSVTEANFGTSVFSGSGITSVTPDFFPDNFTSPGTDTFKNCTSLTKVELPDNMTIVKGFSSCSALTTVILPPSITTIADEAFQFCSKLSSVNIPEGVTYIGTYAFYRCIFQQISIPESVTYLGANAFNGTSLTSVVIPNSITDIKNAFSSCAKLKSITLPTGIKEIAAEAFSSCSALTEIVLPPSVTTIGANAFYNCKALKNVYMGPNIKSMDQNAFYLVTLSNLYITAQTPPSVYSQFNTDVHLHVQGEETLKEYTKETIPDPSGGTLYNQWRYYTNISTMIVPTEIKISKEEASSAPMRIIDNPYSSADHIYGQPGDTFIRMATLIPEDSPMQQTFWSSSDPSKVAVNNAGAISIKEYPEINNPVTLSVETLYSDGPTAKVTIENYLMTDVNSIPSDSENVGSDTSAQTQIYTIGGLPVGNSLNGLTSGIYIVKQGNKVVKLNIR